MAIYRANVAKRPRDLETLRLPCDRDTVFASKAEFMDHHRIVPQLPKSPALKAKVTRPTQDAIDAVRDIVDEVESDTESITREEYRDFLEELQGDIELRLEVLKDG
jgi:hypothetical protein